MWNIVILGILLNAAVYLSFKIRGLDAMPAFPVLAGYIYGPDAGLIAGAIIAASYYIFNIRSIHYAPLTVTISAFTGFAAGFLGGIDVFIAGIALLCIYHMISGFLVSVFGALKPGYFAFVAVNFIVSIAVFYISSFVL